MKKIIYVFAMLTFILSIVLINSSNATFTMTMNLGTNSDNARVGEEVVYTINLNEKIVACNFNLNYDSQILKLVGSGTSNLNVAEKNGEIACIYADISGTGTNTLKIKFKASKETTTPTSVSISGAKFRVAGAETSYTNDDIEGISTDVKISIVKKAEQNNNNNSNNSTTNEKPKDEGAKNNVVDTTVVGTSKLPNTGRKETGYIMLATSAVLLILATVLKYKSDELEKILKSVSIYIIIGLSMTSIFTSKVYANSNNTQIRYNNNLVQEKKTIAIMLDKNDTDRKITKAELMALDTKITDVLNNQNTPIQNTDEIKTGYSVKVSEEKYDVILYGDANSDGVICDSDDIMIVINDYLGINTPSALNSLAANLSNADNVLDIDDVMLMIESYLGTLSGNLVQNLPESNINNETPEQPEEPEETTTYNLKDVVEIGDYVEYPVEYTNVSSFYNINTGKAEDYSMLKNTGWVVLSKDYNYGRVALISAGTPENLSANTDIECNRDLPGCWTCEYVYSSIKSHSVSDNFRSKYQSSFMREVTCMIDGKDIEAVRNIDKFKGILFTDNNGDNTVKPHFWISRDNNGMYMHGYWNGNSIDPRYPGERYKIGLKVIITLKDNILTSGKNANGAWTLIEANN